MAKPFNRSELEEGLTEEAKRIGQAMISDAELRWGEAVRCEDPDTAESLRAHDEWKAELAALSQALLIPPSADDPGGLRAYAQHWPKIVEAKARWQREVKAWDQRDRKREADRTRIRQKRQAAKEMSRMLT